MESRFFVCEMDLNGFCPQLRLVSPSTRGSAEEQKERNTMFAEFFKRFNEVVPYYKPDENKDEASVILEKLEYEQHSDMTARVLGSRGIEFQPLPFEELPRDYAKALSSPDEAWEFTGDPDDLGQTP